jgi:hypothetical protein
MPEGTRGPTYKTSADWLVRGVLARLGDMFDAFVGRKWTPASSLTTSGLVDRLKRLLDSESIGVDGKGKVAPHHISLLLQWDKFATDENISVEKLRNELLVAAIDHINDNLYYTYAPLKVEIKQDYFVDGVKLVAGFDGLVGDTGQPAQMNVTMRLDGMTDIVEQRGEPVQPRSATVTAEYELDGRPQKRSFDIDPGQSITIGRSGTNDLIVDHGSVSKIHASVALSSKSELSVADTGSTNGTFINGERIAYGQAVTFGDDDVVTFGGVAVRFSTNLNDPSDAAAAEPITETLSKDAEP